MCLFGSWALAEPFSGASWPARKYNWEHPHTKCECFTKFQVIFVMSPAVQNRTVKIYESIQMHTHLPKHLPLLERPVRQWYVYTWKVCNYATGDVHVVNMQWWIYPQFAGDIQVVYPQMHSWELFWSKWSVIVNYAIGDKNPRSNNQF